MLISSGGFLGRSPRRALGVHYDAAATRDHAGKHMPEQNLNAPDFGGNTTSAIGAAAIAQAAKGQRGWLRHFRLPDRQGQPSSRSQA